MALCVCSAAVSRKKVCCLGSNYGASNYHVIIFIQLLTLGCNIYEHENVVFGLLCVHTCPNATSEMCLGRGRYPQPSIEQFWWSKPVPNDTIMNTNQSHWFYLITNQHLNSLSSHVGAVLWGTGQWRWVWILVSVQERIKSDFGMVCMHIHGAKKIAPSHNSPWKHKLLFLDFWVQEGRFRWAGSFEVAGRCSFTLWTESG